MMVRQAPSGKTHNLALKAAFQIAYDLAGGREARLTNLNKAQPIMKGIGLGIWWRDVNLAYNALMVCSASTGKKLMIKGARQALPARLCGNDNAINIDEPGKALTKPQIIRAVIGRPLVKSDEKPLGLAYAQSSESVVHQMAELALIQWRGRGFFASVQRQ